MKKLKKEKVEEDKNITKQSEITSIAGSILLSEKKVGDEFGTNEFRNSITLSNGSPPHLDTFEKTVRIWKIVKEVFPDIQFIENPKNHKIHRLRILEKEDLTFKKEIRNELTNLKNKLDNIENKLLELTKSIQNKSPLG